MRQPAEAGQFPGEDQQEAAFIELGWVTCNSISEVDAPGQVSRGAVGAISQAAPEATDAADRDPNGDGDGKEVSGS